MAYRALYREWRPTTFDDVIEQEHVTRTLRNAVRTGRIAHAYLFCGTRGTGKTSMAYIMSRAVNCLDPQDGNPCNKCSICTGILKGNILDVIEMDAASNNSVDNIRSIRDEVAFTPAMTKYKVYIIDEVHMLSAGAFNALLKTLEEPPSHVIFILATTEPHRLPATVLSRCQRYDFHRISVEGIMERLNDILESKGAEITDRAIRVIARVANGALRDAISLLDQCLSTGKTQITIDDVLESAGILQDEAAADIARAIFEQNIPEVMEITDAVLMQGKSPAQFLSSLIYYYRNLLVCSGMENPEMYIDGSDEIIEHMKQQAKSMGRGLITYVIRELSAAEAVIKRSSQPKTYLEVVLINVASMSVSLPEEASILERLAAIENKVERLKNTGIQVKPAPKEYKPGKYGEKTEPEKEPEPAEKPVASASVEGFSWDDVIKALKENGNDVLCTFLSGTTANLANGSLAITFRSNLHKRMVSKDKGYLAAIKKTVDELYGGDNAVSIYDDASPVGEDEFEKSARKAEELGVKLEIE